MKDKIALITFTLILLIGNHNTSYGQQSYITVEQTQGLEFGSIIPGTSDGTVTIGTNNQVTPVNVALLSILPRHRAEFKLQFHLRGIDLFENVKSITVQPSTILNRVGGGGSMQVTGLTQYGALNWYMGYFHNVPHPNYIYFNVGGTLHVKSTTPEGEYTGTYTVTITHD